MKANLIREMAVKDIEERIEAEVANLNQMKINHVISPLEDTSKIAKSRRDIARMKTVLAQKKNQE